MNLETTTRYCQDCRAQTTHQRVPGGSWVCALCGAIWGLIRGTVRT
jgi:ribosomal protein L37AE/L43A